MRDTLVPIDPREAPELLEQLLARVPGYLPGFAAPPNTPGWALLSISARYLETVLERLNQAPEKHKLAFLDQLGVSLLAAPVRDRTPAKRTKRTPAPQRSRSNVLQAGPGTVSAATAVTPRKIAGGATLSP